MLKRIAILLLLFAPIAEAQIKQITGGGYQNSNGSACAGCILYLQLPVDATVTGTGQIVPNLNSYTLDANGNVPANSNLWANDQLTPTGLTYKATLTLAGGGKIWGPEFLSISGVSPISLTQLVPVASSSVFFGNPAILNVANVFTANQTINANLTVSGTGTFAQIGKTVIVDGNVYPKTDAGINSAITAAGCGGHVFLPAGTYSLTDITRTQELLITCPLELGGEGGELTLLQYAVTVPNTEDIIRVAPTAALFGLYLHDFMIIPASASTAAARYGINFDETSGLIAHAVVDRVRIGNTGSFPSNYAVFNTNTVPSCNPLFLMAFHHNTFWGGVSLLNIGDSIDFSDNNNITGPRDFVIQAVSTGCHTDGGAHGIVIEKNNLTPVGGTVIKNAWQGKFAYNDIEATATSTEANNCLVDLQGTAGNATQNFIIEGNYLGANSAFVGCAVRVDQAKGTQIIKNYVVQGSVNAFTFTANADRTYFGYNRMAPDNVIGTFLSDSGTNTSGDFFNQTTGVVSHYGTHGYTTAASVTGVAISSTQVKVNPTNGSFCASSGDPSATGCDTVLWRAGADNWEIGNAFGDGSGIMIGAGFRDAPSNTANSGFIRHTNADKDCWRDAGNLNDHCGGETQIARGVAGCTTAASIGGVCATPITVTWPSAFADSNYTVICWATGAATNLPSSPYQVTRLAASVTVNYFAITAAAASWPTIDCIARHD